MKLRVFLICRREIAKVIVSIRNPGNIDFKGKLTNAGTGL